MMANGFVPMECTPNLFFSFFRVNHLILRGAQSFWTETNRNRFRCENMVHMTGASAGTTKDGLCGAPTVDDNDVGDGAVAGFFQLANIEIFFVNNS